MKVALRASLKDDSWCDRLPWVLLGIRTAPKEDLQSSSVELVYGQSLCVLGDFIPNASVPWSASLQRSTHLSEAHCKCCTMALSTSWSRAIKPLSPTLGVNLTTSPWTVSSPPTKTWVAPWGSPRPRVGATP
ncbi:hypothetical protein AAFF_G00399090 [Aldrovandia affinis]|uniref:Uncharacterized protein n=1 Tax=Aldrovandia affinis TaxID=143900 RepID=A0AAD7WKP6_9TELE|nr:hypothetical protein AAFF_G00399090 [Aldrovandia affinis]